MGIYLPACYLKFLWSPRFQGQALYKLKANRFRQAIEEAFLAERGFCELEMDEGCSLEKSVNDQSIPDGLLEGSGSNNEQECQSEAQVIGWMLHNFKDMGL